MTVLQEILEWSKPRPDWQRDALRRLLLHGELTDTDIHELIEICKKTHGLAESQETVPLAKDHLPESSAGGSAVSLESIFHHRGVNALAEDQTLKFAENLTVVYGDNAAGKTGYIRILKSACRARGQEKILGNVVSGFTPQSPVVSIKYKIGNKTEMQEWAGNGEDNFVSRVSVFDTQSATVYVTEKTDVAFRPFGLDLFDKLVRACKSVRLQLEREQRNLASDALMIAKNKVPKGTAAAKLLDNVTSLTKLYDVQILTRLTSEETSRLALLEKSLLDLQANNPDRLIQQLKLRARRVEALRHHVNEVEAILSDEAVDSVFAIRTEGLRKSKEAKRLREDSFSSEMLAGTGSEVWGTLWEAARKFSEESAYPDKIFPVLQDDAHCVLCQQVLDYAACKRIKQFQTFVTSTPEKELRRLRDAFSRQRKTFTELKVKTEFTEETLREIRIDHESVADTIITALTTAEKRRKAVVHALSESIDLAEECPDALTMSSEVDVLAKHTSERLRALHSNSNKDVRKRMVAEAEELRARTILAEYEKAILDEIDRKRKYAAYGLCINDTKTQSITKKSTAITRFAVTQKLKKSFQSELSSLAFRHVEVELKEVGGSDGILYHKLVLTRAPGIDLPKIVSEGEQRCLSIAAFFAELSTADDLSGIVFDDPVSSLDYQWRDGVACRLVEEAKKRQVIVFTHDVVFLLMLKGYSKQKDVQQLDQHVRQLSKGAGVCTEELPWVALPASKKIKYLKNEWQTVDKLFRNGQKLVYEKEAKYLYGLLREAWERALEEILLGGIVERFRPSIQTQQLKSIADISASDCSTVDAAMSKCSMWLPGHDQAPAARAPVPEPSELKADIENLANWVSDIRKRRK